MSVSRLDPRLYLRPAPQLLPGPPLRICIVASASLPIPPFDGYGGTQRGIHDIIEMLRRRGHHVTLCCTGDSLTEADERIMPLPRAIWAEDSPYPVADRDRLAEQHVAGVLDALASRSFDLINVRYDHYGLLQALVQRGQAPIVYSLHNVANERTIPIVRDFAGRVTINAHCDTHRNQYPNAEELRVVYYGMDVHDYPYGPAPLSTAHEQPTLPILRQLRAEGSDYLVSVGRIGQEKGQRSAIEIARAAGLPLVIVGEPFSRDPAGQAYFAGEILPRIDGRAVRYFGRANEIEKRELVRFARAVLFTTGLEQPDWREPFARVIMESLSSGTPLVAHPNGCAAEVINDDVAVFGNDVAELARGAREIGRISRRACRRYAELAYSRTRMGRDYEALFHEVVQQWRPERVGLRLAAVG